MTKRKKKKSSARRHTVRAKLLNFELAKAKAALTLEVYDRGEKVGEMQVGRGSLFWWGAKRQNGEQISWSRFAEMMDKLAYGEG